MLAAEFFTTAHLKQMRDEICNDGFVADRLLADQPDCPVFGVNLACLYPFPAGVKKIYESLTVQLSRLDPGVYVYPVWATHVTIATFINFTQQKSPTTERIAELKQVLQKIITRLDPGFGGIGSFDLLIEHPVISRKAAILPLSDPSDAIARIRTELTATLARDPSLRVRLESLGLNIPPLVHSTMMRFAKVPADTQLFVERFDEISRTIPRTAMRVKELYITAETKPYMREGEIFWRRRL